MTKYLYIHTIGCQMNVYDSEQIVRLLYPLGYRQTSSVKMADLVIVNTCAIREKAEQKVYSFLGRLSRLKKRNPNLILGVGGCVAQQEGRKMLKRAPYLDLIFGTHALSRLPEMIKKIESTEILNRYCIDDVAFSDSLDELELSGVFPGQREITKFITIMTGCENFCTYCVVPYVRGKEISRSPDAIINEISNMVKNGVKEVTLLGQNVNSYGLKEGMCSFPELLDRVNSIPELKRIRFITSHPKDLSIELIQTFGKLEKLCKHIHLPVQSGSDRILKKMNRKYTQSSYLKKIEMLKKVCPDIAITSDIIVGFPGESKDDFHKTLSLIQEVEYDNLFAFKYSDRAIAPASKFSPKVDEQEKKERLKELLEMQACCTMKKNNALLKTKQIIMVEGQSKQGSGQWTGRTTGNKIVNFTPKNKELPYKGQMLCLMIEKAFSHSLWAQC
ncbi:tRNA-2-methylthio-N(6)-dimethylallyladenosine synthase [Candidatus Magnetomoraceae bacterium gMMP-1]